MADQQITITLRPWSDGDLWLLERLMGDPVMMAHLGGPETPEKIRERHARYCKMVDSSTEYMFVIVVGEQSAGSVGYWEKDWRDQSVWETGWSVLPEFQGQGLAAKGTLAVIEDARAQERHRYIHAFPSVDNAPSNAVCRKAGFTLLGDVEFEYPPGTIMRCNDWRIDLSPLNE
jgi:RimJ/RimL family protein N-acetyltransferase